MASTRSAGITPYWLRAELPIADRCLQIWVPPEHILRTNLWSIEVADAAAARAVGLRVWLVGDGEG